MSVSPYTLKPTFQLPNAEVLSVQTEGKRWFQMTVKWTVPYVGRDGKEGENTGVIVATALWGRKREEMSSTIRKGDIVSMVGYLRHNKRIYNDKEYDNGIELDVQDFVIVKRGAASKVLDAPQPELEKDQPVTRASLSDALAELTGKVPPTSWNKTRLESEIKRLTATSTLR